MQDRVSLYPGRVKLTPVPGQANTYDMTRADQPTQEGTPLNKANLFSDTTASALGLTADKTPNDALAKLKTLIDAANANANTKTQMQIASYVGTGLYGEENAVSISASFVIKAAIMLCYTSSNYIATPLYNNNTLNVMVPDLLTTSYVNRFGFDESYSGSYGKTSSDKKTISWYAESGDFYNGSNTTYYVLLLG